VPLLPNAPLLRHLHLGGTNDSAGLERLYTAALGGGKSNILFMNLSIFK